MRMIEETATTQTQSRCNEKFFFKGCRFLSGLFDISIGRVASNENGTLMDPERTESEGDICHPGFVTLGTGLTPGRDAKMAYTDEVVSDRRAGRLMHRRTGIFGGVVVVAEPIVYATAITIRHRLGSM